jgi:thioredoxin reductase
MDVLIVGDGIGAHPAAVHQHRRGLGAVVGDVRCHTA